MNTLPFAPRSVHPDGNEQAVGAYPDFAERCTAGQRAAHADRGAAFALCWGERRVARFGFDRLVPRAAAGDPDALTGAL